MPIIDIFPETTPALLTASRLDLTFDILPDDLTSLARELWLPRVKVDGAEVLIREQCSLSETDTQVGETLQFTLLKDSDKSLFTSSASIEFGIGRKIAGVWDAATFITLLTGARVQSIEHNISGPNSNPQDVVTITAISETADRLTKTAETGLIIYDSDRVTINDSDLKPVVDADGNTYAPELMAIPGLKLRHLLQEILITRCGFDSYETDLPENDYPIQRYEVKLGGRFYDGLKPFICWFSPAITPVGDTLWITDTTRIQPDGFPAAKSITLDRPLNIGASSSKQRLDALNIQYVGLENNYDFTTFKYEYPKSSNGSLRIETERITIEFRKKTSPTTNVIVRDALNIENKRTFSDDTEIDSTSDAFEFTSNGRLSHRRKVTEKLLPPVSDITAAKILQTVLTETDEYAYQPHPFMRRAEFCARLTSRSAGILTSDIDNPNPDSSAYISDFLTAYRSGNLNDHMTYAEGPIKFREETGEPLKDGQARVRVFEVDEMRGVVIADYTEDRAGETALSGVQTSSEELLVFAAAGASRSADRVENFPTGELPLRYGIPLARRALLQRQNDSGTVSIPVIGYDSSLRKGIPVTPKYRDDTDLGTFLITGRTIAIDGNGLIMNLSGRQMAPSPMALDEIEKYARTIEEEESLVFTILIYCLDGYSLSMDPADLTDLGVEVRHAGGFIPPPWIDLGSGSQGLSDWDGTFQNFEVRVNAGTVSAVTRRSFSLVVDIA
jgi:hypothetical protein